jgi:O-antigen ligase
LKTGLCLFLVLVVGLSPFVLGSNRPLPWSYNAILAGVLALSAAGTMLLARGQTTPMRFDYIVAPMLLITLGIGWAGVQLLPLPDLLPVHPAWQVAGDVLGKDVTASISINRHETLWSLARWATVACIFLAAYVLARPAEDARRLVDWFLLAGLLAAAYGLARVVLGIPKILWWPHEGHHFLTAGFLNRNSAAMFFGLCLVCSLSLLIDRFRRIRAETEGRSTAGSMQVLADNLAGRLGFYMLCLVVFLMAVLMTGSRGGIASSFVACLVLLVLYGVRAMRSKSRSRSSGGGPAFVLGVLIIAGLGVTLIELAGGNLAQRLTMQGFEDADRLEVYRQSLVALRDYAWTGSGLGTFQDVYQAYRIDLSRTQSVWDKAHNDYLELLIGLGVPAALLVLAGLVGMGMKTLSGFFRRRRGAAYPAAAFAACVLVSLHSLTDFGIQMQANAMAFALVLAAGLAQSTSGRG